MDTGNLNMMVRQILRNLAIMGEEAAVVATAKHIIEFWEPRMIAALEAEASPDNAAILEAIRSNKA
jgi:formate dehydrogenase subunit delta